MLRTLAVHAAPVYISEISPAHVRGLLVALKEAFIVFGILCGFFMSALVVSTLHVAGAWRVIWAPPAVVASVVVLGMVFMPSSPRWMVLRAFSLKRGAAYDSAMDRARQELLRLRDGWDGVDVTAEVRVP